MSFYAGTAVDRLFALVNKTTIDSGLPTGMLLAAQAAVLAACEECRAINPALFAVPRSFSLAAPASITFTLAADLFTFSALTGTIPRAGCTILANGANYHNQIATLSGTTGTLARPEVGSSGARTATVWEDAWTAGGAPIADRIVGDASANGRPFAVLSDPSEVTWLTRRTDFQADYPITPRPPFGAYFPAYPFTLWNALGQWASGPWSRNELDEPGYREPYEDARIMACWPEFRITAANAAPQTIIRFAPMPNAVTVIRLSTVGFPDFTGSLAAIDVGLPDGMQETVFMPIALNQWRMTAWFKPDKSQGAVIDASYARAVSRLRSFRQILGAQPVRDPG